MHPFRALGQGNGPWLVAWLADLEYEKNSQQLEEFEYMAALGPALVRRFGNDTSVDMVLGLSMACNEEEKDDDWPRENFDIGRDKLNRRGCGQYLQWKSRITLPTATEFGVSLDYYEGTLSYGDQYYRRERANLYMHVPLTRRHHHLRLTVTITDRDAEIDFTGFDDRLRQASLQYIYRF